MLPTKFGLAFTTLILLSCLANPPMDPAFPERHDRLTQRRVSMAQQLRRDHREAGQNATQMPPL